MNKKKFMTWIAGILAMVILLVLLVVINEPEKGTISRAAAYKAAALLTADKKECEQWSKAQKQSFFSLKEQNDWYVKYMDYLYGKGIITTDLAPATAKSAESFLTYGEVEALINKLDPSLKSYVHAGKNNRNKAYPEENWWFLYDSLRKNLDMDDQVKELELFLYGTPANVEKAVSWSAYTSEGDFGAEGLGLDSYIDQELKVLVRGDEMICVRDILSDSAIYRNVWLTSGAHETFQVHLGSIVREFPLDTSLGQPESFLNNVADIYLKKGKLQKVTLKKERMTGKVLSVKDNNTIEIEGYGSIKLDKDFKVYKIYGEFAEQDIKDILVGYDIQEFVVAKGKICAALTVREFEAKIIRVLLKNTGFESLFHQSVKVVADTDMTLLSEDGEEVIPSGKELVIGRDDDRLKNGRIILRPQSANGQITVKSIERAQGSPSYGGNIEITKEDDGLILVNELFLEDYLTRVVPSEMPSSYEKEALKAQAVCARTYAYRQIQANGYSQYGAHVDDSTKFQVYNNIKTDAKTEAAVKETYGKMLFYDDKPIEAFYFSTSCGHTTDGSVWGGDPSNVPYLEGVLLREQRDNLNLTTNAEFEKFIKNKDFPSYDSAFPMYRWETTVTNIQLAEKIGGVGTILNVSVTERGVGGAAKKLRIEGSEGIKTISGEDEIRYRLGNKALTITKNDKKTLTGWDGLPSAFVSVEVDGVNDQNVTTFHIYGGGYGHGAGMSQNGAQGMAIGGKDYEEILKFFYKGVEVREAGE